MNTVIDTTPIAGHGVLAALRDLDHEPERSMADMLHIAAEQAGLLQKLLPGPRSQVSAQLTNLIPAILVEQVAHLPAPGISYWANHYWHIHVREDDSANATAFTVFHQLKRIIDHPLRRHATAFGDAGWDILAKYFAWQVLTGTPSRMEGNI
ncbi:hypothetical protein EDD99_5158 [Streptomyces sp. 846.5]|nr:hypothetical protein [Streptomyces sp. 846.5]TDU06595.1 hypothetical protein EDD99_5158 [Streptomyces sp. 846.5]